MPKDLVLSPSGIILYQNCPYSFFLRYIKKLKPIIEDDSALKLGKSVHSVLENFYKSIDLKTNEPDVHLVEALKKSAQQNWDCSIDSKKREEMNNSIFLWLQFEVQRFKKYKELNILDKFCPVATEEDITDWNSKLRAIIDKRCVGQSGNIYCVDYKTDKNLPALRNFKGDLKQIDEKYKIQAALNAMVLKTKDIKLDNFFYQFVRTPDKLLSIPLTSELFAETNELIKKIRETTEFEKNYKSCFYCNLRLYCKTENSCVHCVSGEVI